MPNENAKFEAFLFCVVVVVVVFALASERTFIKTCSIDGRCYRTGTYTVYRRARASFSPDILQAGAVKGLIVTHLSLTMSETLERLSPLPISTQKSFW